MRYRVSDGSVWERVGERGVRWVEDHGGQGFRWRSEDTGNNLQIWIPGTGWVDWDSPTGSPLAQEALRALVGRPPWEKLITSDQAPKKPEVQATETFTHSGYQYIRSEGGVLMTGASSPVRWGEDKDHDLQILHRGEWKDAAFIRGLDGHKLALRALVGPPPWEHGKSEPVPNKSEEAQDSHEELLTKFRRLEDAVNRANEAAFRSETDGGLNTTRLLSAIEEILESIQPDSKAAWGIQCCIHAIEDTPTVRLERKIRELQNENKTLRSKLDASSEAGAQCPEEDELSIAKKALESKSEELKRAQEASHKLRHDLELRIENLELENAELQRSCTRANEVRKTAEELQDGNKTLSGMLAASAEADAQQLTIQSLAEVGFHVMVVHDSVVFCLDDKIREVAEREMVKAVQALSDHFDACAQVKGPSSSDSIKIKELEQSLARANEVRKTAEDQNARLIDQNHRLREAVKVREGQWY